MNRRDRVRDLAVTIARDLDRVIAGDCYRELANHLAVGNPAAEAELDRARELLRELLRELDSDRDLEHARDLAVAIARAVDRGVDSDLDRPEFVERAHQLVAHTEHTAVRDSASIENPRPAATSGSHPVQPAPLAGRLTQTVTWALPPTARVRYREEFRSELYELAAAEASRWTQLAYALRLLDRVWILRAELRDVTMQQARS